jgi:hypothetical protein
MAWPLPSPPGPAHTGSTAVWSCPADRAWGC